MKAHLDWFGQSLTVDFSAGRSLAIALDPHLPQPRFFAPDAVTSQALEGNGFIGDVRQGGSCNAEILNWAPHCHGTHTECIGHILPERIRVQDIIDPDPALARLYTIHHPVDEHAIAKLKGRLEDDPSHCTALILRTLPNDESKTRRDYSVQPEYPVLRSEFMHWLTRLPLRHLLLDTPSLDAASDQGLINHRIWWGQSGDAAQHGYTAEKRSLTEMIYVANDIPDDLYWLHLELSPLCADATPSRPMIYPVELKKHEQ